MLTEEQKIIHKEFRKYLRVEEGKTGTMLKTFTNAAEKHLPALVRQYVYNDFDCIYNASYSVKDLMTILTRLNNDEILAAPWGYISSKAMEAYIRFYAKRKNIDLTTISVPDIGVKQDMEEDEYQRTEGRVTETKVLHRQRNRTARQKCLEKSGYTCYVCGFNFEKAYGEIGKGFMEVHHTKPMATYEDEHPIPQSELCALCSNCHSIVHRKREVLDVDELKRVFESKKLRNKTIQNRQ